MIIDNTASQITSNVSSNKTQKMTVKQSGKLFTLLSDNLYSDKIGSIIRELSCNARDSHIESKNNKPFDIFLPCSLDPTFKIKDYGLGMSKKNVLDIFSCYGESTKGETNELIGAFGLGSKTPFAYTNSFNITSIYDNKKTSYTIYIDSEGFPAITEMFCIDTVEENGFEIFFGVNDRDFRLFSNAVEKQLKYFDFNYNIDSRLKELFKFDTKDPKFVFEDEECAIFRTTWEKSFIVFGGLSYEISNKDKYKIKDFEVFLKCDIGDIDVSLSREDISYTDKTKNLILKKISKTKDKLINFIISESEKFDREFDLEHWLYKNYNIEWIIKNIFGKKWNFRLYLNLASYDKLRFYHREKRIYNIQISKTSPLSFHINDSNPKISARKMFEYYHSEVFVLPKYACSKKELNKAKVQINQFKIDFDTSEFINILTEDELNKINDIEIEKEQNNTINYTTIYKYNGKYIYSELYDIDEYSIKQINEEDVLFAVKYHNNIIDPNDDKILFYRHHLEVLKTIMCKDKHIFCFTKQQYKKAKKEDWFKKLTCVKDHVLKQVNQYKKDQDKYEFSFNKIKNIDTFNNKANINDIEDELLKKYCNKDKIVLEYKLKHFLTNNNWTEIKFDTDENEKEIEFINERYKFLNSVHEWSLKDKEEFTYILNCIYKRSLTNG